MRAQMTKNAVIVPEGAKGGFYLRGLPDDPAAVRAQLERGYVTFVSGLLDLTDNLVDGEVVRPDGVRVLDEDDTYLVVAADKGTATFSDTANGVAESYGFWLGDAFASGGSNGYDHKALGITARGAWESLKRHFRELDLDPARRRVHRRGHRRHVRRRVRQRHAAQRQDPPRRGLRPPAHLHRPRARRGPLVRRAQATVREGRVLLGRLRPRADLRGRRRLAARRQARRAAARRCGRPWLSRTPCSPRPS